ncbi:hypothetical protein GQ457_14G014460 [Hibiscus cannabinus]
MRPDMLLKVREEVKKQVEVGFLKVAKYPEWVANIVPVPKKDGKVRMCVDYRDLNRASPKDNFPLPHIDTLVDNTSGNSWFSFMDGFSGYNQIKMHPEDMEKTTFVTMWGTFCYQVIPFGLKNAGAMINPEYVKAEYQPRFPAQADKKGIAKGRKLVKVKDLKPKRIKGYLEYKFSKGVRLYQSSFI